MTDLIDEVGQYCHGGVGVMSADRVVQAPPTNQINRLMVDLIDWLNDSDVQVQRLISAIKQEDYSLAELMQFVDLTHPAMF